MEVVLLGSMIPEIHAIGRALARALDATVVDGDRVRLRSPGCADPPAAAAGEWLEALRLELPAPRARPHVVVTCASALTPEQRGVLRRGGMCLVVLRGRAPVETPTEPDEPDEPDVRVVIDDRESVELVAARVLGSLVRRLEPSRAPAPLDGDWPPHGDDVS